MIDRTSIVLISGAISNTLDNFRLIVLKGRPIVLPKNGPAEALTFIRFKKVIQEAIRIFKDKEEFLILLLSQLHGSMFIRKPNLTRNFITHYLNKVNKTSVIIFFCGDTDKVILDRLNITEYPMLNMISFDTKNDKHYNVHLSNFKTRELICKVPIAHIQNRRGRYLSLTETHNNLCPIKHRKVKYAHDPYTDVLYTKCIFDIVIKNFGYNNMISYLDRQIN